MKESLDPIKMEWSLLHSIWKNTRQHWCDEVADHFEKRFWSKWEKEVSPAIKSMQELKEVLRRIKADTNHHR